MSLGFFFASEPTLAEMAMFFCDIPGVVYFENGHAEDRLMIESGALRELVGERSVGVTGHHSPAIGIGCHEIRLAVEVVGKNCLD